MDFCKGNTFTCYVESDTPMINMRGHSWCAAVRTRTCLWRLGNFLVDVKCLYGLTCPCVLTVTLRQTSTPHFRAVRLCCSHELVGWLSEGAAGQMNSDYKGLGVMNKQKLISTSKFDSPTAA